MEPRVFGISGLRGVVGQDLTTELVSAVSDALGVFLGRGIVSIGRDTRPSGPMFEAAAATGLLAAGCDVEHLGICPTPTVLHHARTHKRAGAVIVTASHNPEEWNGLKFAGADGLFLARDRIDEFRRQALSTTPSAVDWRGGGRSIRYEHAVADHVDAIRNHPLFADVRAPDVRVGVDGVNGAAGPAAVELLRAVGAEPVALNCSTEPDDACRGFPRAPEPTPANINDLCRLVTRDRLNFGVAFDPDGDRASFVDETGTALGEELTICLACRYLLPGLAGQAESGGRSQPVKVVVNLSTTSAVDDVCREFGVETQRSPVGESAVAELMQRIGAELGGEGNGGVILPAVNYTRDGLVAIACVLGLVARERRPLSAIRASFPQYWMHKDRIALSARLFAARRTELVRTFADARLDEQDGLRFAGDGWWIHARPSNTEPVVRIVAEARDRSQLDRVIARTRVVLT